MLKGHTILGALSASLAVVASSYWWRFCGSVSVVHLCVMNRRNWYCYQVACTGMLLISWGYIGAGSSCFGFWWHWQRLRKRRTWRWWWMGVNIWHFAIGVALIGWGWFLFGSINFRDIGGISGSCGGHGWLWFEFISCLVATEGINVVVIWRY